MASTKSDGKEEKRETFEHKLALKIVSSFDRFECDPHEDMILKQPIDPVKPIIVMPLDPSENCLFAMRYYIRFIHKPENMVIACYVSEDINRKKSDTSTVHTLDKPGCLANCKNKFFDKVVVEVGPSPGMLEEWQKQDKYNYHRTKYRAKHMFRANGVNYEFRHLTGPDPATAIIELRKAVNASLIVMGSRGLGQFKSRVFGSVSDKVMHNCKVPVLVIKKPSKPDNPVYDVPLTGV